MWENERTKEKRKKQWQVTPLDLYRQSERTSDCPQSITTNYTRLHHYMERHTQTQTILDSIPFICPNTLISSIDWLVADWFPRQSLIECTGWLTDWLTDRYVYRYGVGSSGNKWLMSPRSRNMITSVVTADRQGIVTDFNITLLTKKK